MQPEAPTVLQSLRSELAPLRGLWQGFEADLLRMGITALADLRGQPVEALTESYRAMVGRPPDPILHPYFAALVSFAETGKATPWWHFWRSEAPGSSGGAVHA